MNRPYTLSLLQDEKIIKGCSWKQNHDLCWPIWYEIHNEAWFKNNALVLRSGRYANEQ